MAPLSGFFDRRLQENFAVVFDYSGFLGTSAATYDWARAFTYPAGNFWLSEEFYSNLAFL